MAALFDCFEFFHLFIHFYFPPFGLDAVFWFSVWTRVDVIKYLMLIVKHNIASQNMFVNKYLSKNIK